MSCAYTVKKVTAPCWEKIEAVELVHQPWLEPCEISAKAQLCHDGENLYVRMEAKEAEIRATLQSGAVIVKGEKLHIQMLDLDAKTAVVSGVVNSLMYVKVKEKSEGGLFAKIMK